jgi:hypothetical protein
MFDAEMDAIVQARRILEQDSAASTNQNGDRAGLSDFEFKSDKNSNSQSAI